VKVGAIVTGNLAITHAAGRHLLQVPATAVMGGAGAPRALDRVAR
jgi:hypothetical protein